MSILNGGSQKSTGHTREWRSVTKTRPCPACGKPDWCAWTQEGWLKCERTREVPSGFVHISFKDGGAVFKPDEASDKNRKSPKSSRREERAPRNQETFDSANDAIMALEKKHGPRSAHWTYRNAEGGPVGVVVRWDTPTSKIIRPVSWNADGSGWLIGGMPAPRPLYGLPELLATNPGERLYVTEGEKAADAARKVGLVATTSPHGSNSASKADWSPLAGHDVVILPDYDEAGEKYADDVARLAKAAGAKSVRVVRLVGMWAEMPEGGDMADLVEHRGGDVNTIRAEVEVLADKTEPDTVTPDTIAVPAFKSFPVNVLPEPIRAYVKDAAKAIGCDASFIALPVLSGLASAIGNSHRISLKRGWSEPAIIWTAIVGESGTAKSPALEFALRPIRKRQHEAMQRHAEAMKEHAEDLMIYERDAAQWKKQSKSDTPAPAKPEAPIAERCWTDDTTTEALAVLLQQNPRGLLMVRDELAGWFNFDRYVGGKGGGDVAKYLEMFGGRPMIVDRRGTPLLYVRRAAVSITGGIQPATLRRALGQEHRDNGLAARLLFAMPPRKPKKWTEADLDEKTVLDVDAVFDRLFSKSGEWSQNIDEEPQLVTLSEKGKVVWIDFYNAHATEQANLSGDDAAAWSKLEGYAARFALIIHMTRWASKDASLCNPLIVDEVSISAGVALTRWFGEEAQRVYSILSETDNDRKHRTLIEWIKKKGGSITLRDLQRGPREYRDGKKAETALMELALNGWGQWENNSHMGGRGRPVDQFKLF